MMYHRRSQNNLKTNAGFTIIEVVIVLALSSVLLLALLGLFEWHQKIFTLEDASVRTTTDVRNAMYNITMIVAQGTSVVSTHNFSGTDRTSSGTSLVIQVPSVDSSDEVIPATYDYVAYYLTNGTLYQEISPGTGSSRKSATRKIAGNVQKFLLSYDNGTPASAGAVTVNLQVALPTRTGTVNTEVNNTIFLRNK